MPLSVSGVQLCCACVVVCTGCGACGACVVGAGAAEVWTGTATAAIVVGGALVTGGAFVTTGGGAAGEGTAGRLEAACDGEAVPLTAVGLRAVVLGGGVFALTATMMITKIPTTTEIMLRRCTDQSGRNQSRATPTGKQKISKSTT